MGRRVPALVEWFDQQVLHDRYAYSIPSSVFTSLTKATTKPNPTVQHDPNPQTNLPAFSTHTTVHEMKPPVLASGAFTHQRTMRTSAPRLDAPEVPDLSAYQASSASGNRALSYFMIGSMGVLSASVAKSTVAEFLGTMSASADVLALAKVEVELASIPEGKNAIIKWRGKPVFIRHRTQGEIDEARQVDWKGLRDPQPDDARVKKPEWLVMLGVCTHLGCVPIGESGDYGGWWVFVFFLSPPPSPLPSFRTQERDCSVVLSSYELAHRFRAAGSARVMVLIMISVRV